MFEIPSAIGLLIALYFCRSDKPKNVTPRPEEPTKQDYGPSYFCPATTEIKSLYNRGASCSVYRDGTVKAFSFYYGKGGRPITQDEFNSLEFHATRGGVWKKEINNIDGTLKSQGKLLGRPRSLDAIQIDLVEQRLAEDETIAGLAREFGTSRQSIMRIRQSIQ